MRQVDRSQNPFRQELRRLAVLLASENVCSAEEAMRLEFREALRWMVQIEHKHDEMDRAMKRARKK